MSSAQDNEFATFGIVNNKLKAGLVLGLLSLSLTANIYQSQDNKVTTKQLYEKMLERADKAARDQTAIILEKPVENINRAAARVDTAVNVSVASAKTADSAGRVILNLKKENEK